MTFTLSLTNVFGETYFGDVEFLNHILEYGEKINFLVAVVDINNLKMVNDTYGHEYGDKLIQSGAAILKKVWGSDYTYRIGGDEFAIVCSDMKIECAKKRILLYEEAVEDYNRQNNCEKIYLQMAIGMAVYSSETDKEYMDVFRRADSAMYEDKKQKKQKGR